MANTQVGDTTYVFGTNATAPFMQIESFQEEEAPEFEAEAQNNEGNTVSVVKGPSKFTITASGYLTGATELPDRGDSINIGGHTNAIFDKISINRSNKDFCKAEISAIKYDQATIL